MVRRTLLSIAAASLVASLGCEKKDTNVPEAPMEEAEWAPPEGDEPEEVGEQDEEKAPGLSAAPSDEDA